MLFANTSLVASDGVFANASLVVWQGIAITAL
jgi:hypothetical protein